MDVLLPSLRAPCGGKADVRRRRRAGFAASGDDNALSGGRRSDPGHESPDNLGYDAVIGVIAMIAVIMKVE
jgi:hypothetical protein